MYNANNMEIIKSGKPISFSAPPCVTRKIYRNITTSNSISRKDDIQFPYDLYLNNKEIILSIEYEDCCSAFITHTFNNL